MDIRKCFPSKYLEAADLNGEVHTLTIVRLTIEEVGTKKEQRPAVWFQGVQKAMVLNKTNANTIAALYGFETEGWINKSIAIFPSETEFGGKMVSCIRVKSDLPAATTNLATAAAIAGNGSANPPTISALSHTSTSTPLSATPPNPSALELPAPAAAGSHAETRVNLASILRGK
jgi:hypothetical protein